LSLAISKPSRIELRDSTVRGTSNLYHAWGIKINSGGISGSAKHTIILDNATLKHMGGNNAVDAGYALLAEGQHASDTKLINITIYECNYGLTLGDWPSDPGDPAMAVNYTTAIRGGVSF